MADTLTPDQLTKLQSGTNTLSPIFSQSLGSSSGANITGSSGSTYNTAGIAPPNFGAAVPSSSLTISPLNLPASTNPNDSVNSLAFMNSIGQTGNTGQSLTPELDKSLNEYNALSTATQSPEQQQMEQQQGQLTNQYASLSNQLANKGADTTALEQQYGLPQKMADVQKVKEQLTQLQTEFNTQYSNNETRGVLTGTPTIYSQGANAALQRQQSVLAGNLGIQLAALQENYQLAQQLVDKTIDRKYEGIQQQIDNTARFLQLNQDNLSRAEQKQAQKMNYVLQQRQQALDDQKEKDKTIQNLMIEAAKSGADSATLSKIQGAKSVEEAIGSAGDALGAEFKQKVAQQKFENDLALSKLAIDRAQLGISQARLAFDKQKEAFDQAMKLNPGGVATQPMQQAMAKAGIDLTTKLLTDKGLNSAVGPNYFARFSVANQLTGVKSNFIAGVEQLRSNLNLQALIDAKSKGATFGALSDQELQVLANTATKIGSWAITKDGKVTGYNANEKDFRAELDKINNFAKLDYVLKGGDPNSVGLKQTPDGGYWVQNSDGSMTKLE